MCGREMQTASFVMNVSFLSLKFQLQLGLMTIFLLDGVNYTPFIFWTLSNFELFVLQRNERKGGFRSDGNSSTSVEEKRPLVQDDMNCHTHTHTHQ